jgi:hypothetical protein
LGWFVDMSAIGASIGFFFTCSATYRTLKNSNDGGVGLKILSLAGASFSVVFVVLQLIPIPGLEGVHFCWQSYLMLAVWCIIGVVFYLKQRKHIAHNK